MSPEKAHKIIERVEEKSGGYFLVEAAIGENISEKEFFEYLSAQATIRQKKMELTYA